MIVTTFIVDTRLLGPDAHGSDASGDRDTCGCPGPVGNMTGPPDSGPRVVRVQRPACWAGGLHDEAEATHTRADRPEVARGRSDAERGHGSVGGAAASRGLGVVLGALARAVRGYEG